MNVNNVVRGAVARKYRDPRDYSDRYNTRLTSAEEAQYQEWAKSQGRENDVYDYDLRGAWKEIMSGTMSEDERGHLGDKYKKPNHVTFSTQSKYSTKETPGGTWEQDENGQVSYTPSDHVLRLHGKEKLKGYFENFEQGVQLRVN